MLSQGLGVYHTPSRNTSIGSIWKMRVLKQRQIPRPCRQSLAILPIQIVFYRISLASTFPENFGPFTTKNNPLGPILTLTKISKRVQELSVTSGWISFAIRLISKGERSGLLTQSQRWKHKIISRLCCLVRLRIWNGTKERNTDTAAT